MMTSHNDTIRRKDLELHELKIKSAEKMLKQEKLPEKRIKLEGIILRLKEETVSLSKPVIA